MKRGSLILTSVFLISMLSQMLVIHAQSVIPPIQLQGFKEVGTLPQNQNVIFTLYIPLKNQGLLYYYAQAVSNPSSPLYHHFLTKEEVEKLFYPTSQFNQVLSYLRSEGFNVLFTATDSVIVAEGTVGQIKSALGVNYAVYSNGSLTYYTVYGVPKFNVYVVSENLTPLFFEHPSTLLTQKDLEKFSQAVNQTFSIEAYWPTALQKVYNLTWLFNKGYEGQNYTIGILDFYGDPYIAQQLAYFDKLTGLPNPPNFTIVPIGPYNPNLGVINVWSLEISLDVEIAHVMAPKANITLYVANPYIPLSAAIAYIVSQDEVDTLSQSFAIPPESFLSFLPGQIFYSWIVLTDEYYAMGVAEGITFIAASGDAGGSGYSNGPIGTIGYPSVSPYVLAAGGTTTYIQFPNGSYLQTAWSSMGFVPNFFNEGGSTGGVSIVEPKPWYQFSLTTPATYPNGRETPDVSANANVFPGIYIVGPYNTTIIGGGTSEASPLIAGALVTVMSYLGHKLGLITPTLYQIAENSSLYSKVFYPITFGYNIPWTAGYGYNLVTGWGVLNFGELATVLSTLHSKPQLSVVVNIYNQAGETPEEFFPGQQMLVVANITYNNISVTSGRFYVTIESVEGNITTVAMSYDPKSKQWVATVTLPSNASGILFVYVYGSSNGIDGLGNFETFSGYYVEFLSPITFFAPLLGKPFDSNITPYIIADVTNIYGEPAPPNSTFSLTLYSYNITSNSFVDLGSVTLSYNSSSRLWVGSLPTLPSGVVLAEASNAYGFDPFMNGIYLQTMLILPDVFAMPGSVSEGQYIIIQGSIEPPSALNSTYPFTYINTLYGTNITAYLLNSAGKVISSGRVLLLSSGKYLGYLKIPTGINPGIYTVLLEADHYSYALNEYITGQFYGQIYVVPSESVPQIHTVSYAYEGQTIQIYANITYSNGTEVKFGMYSAIVYPKIFSSNYSYISQITFSIFGEVDQIPLWYNPSLNLWVGNVTLPSSLSLGNLTYFVTTYYGVPFDIYISGVSANGVPTTTNISAQYEFFVLPYTEVQGRTIDSGLTYDAFLNNVTIVGNVTLVNDVLENTKIEGHVTIVNSNITSITVKDGSVKIIDSQVSSINAINSSVTLVNTFAQFVNLTSSSTISLIDSKIANVSPSLPSVSIISPKPNNNITGNLTVSYSVAGKEVSEVKIFLNGELLNTSSSTSGSYTINTSLYPDGTYNITVEAVQTDGLSSSVSEFVNFENQLLSLNTQLPSDVSTINSQISSTASTLNSKISTAQTYAIVGIALAMVAIIGIIAVGILLMRRR